MAVEKAILIRSNETDMYKQLGWWNISKVPALEDAKYIFVHNGKGNVIGAYSLSKINSWGAECIVPYATLQDVNKNDPRVSFYEFAKPLDVDWFSVNTPIYKKGQGAPIMVVNFDKKTRTII